MAITLQHPITFDQYDICAKAKGRSLDRLKLSMLKSTWKKLELEVPPKLIRRKRVLLEKSREKLHLPWACWLKFQVFVPY